MQEIQAKNVAVGKKLKEPPAIKSGKGRGEASFFKVTCKVAFKSNTMKKFCCNFKSHLILFIPFVSSKTGLCSQRNHQFCGCNEYLMQDNGRGMPHDEIPNMFGRGTMPFISL